MNRRAMQRAAETERQMNETAREQCFWIALIGMCLGIVASTLNLALCNGFVMWANSMVCSLWVMVAWMLLIFCLSDERGRE